MAARGGGSGGFKGLLATGVTVLLIVAVILAWAKVNNISSVEGGYQYFKAVSDKVWSCGWGNIKWNCKEGQTPPGGSTGGVPGGTSQDGSSGSTPGAKSSTQPGGTNPQDPTLSFPKPGEGGLPATASKDDYLKALDKVPTASASGVAYARADWKHWDGVPCNTRKLVLQRDGKEVKVDKTSATCTVTAGSWYSPYDKKTLNDQLLVDIDHVVPLNYAAQHGGQAWDAAKKEAYANDMGNLLAVSATTNRAKGDKGPADYMPDRDYHCQYSKIWISTVTKYGLTITDKDKFVLKDGIQKC